MKTFKIIFFLIFGSIGFYAKGIRNPDDIFRHIRAFIIEDDSEDNLVALGQDQDVNFSQQDVNFSQQLEEQVENVKINIVSGMRQNINLIEIHLYSQFPHPFLAKELMRARRVLASVQRLSLQEIMSTNNQELIMTFLKTHEETMHYIVDIFKKSKKFIRKKVLKTGLAGGLLIAVLLKKINIQLSPLSMLGFGALSFAGGYLCAILAKKRFVASIPIVFPRRFLKIVPQPLMLQSFIPEAIARPRIAFAGAQKC